MVIKIRGTSITYSAMLTFKRTKAVAVLAVTTEGVVNREANTFVYF